NANAEGAVDGLANLIELVRVGVAGGVEHHEQGEQQGEHVGVADDPALVVVVRLCLGGFSAAHAASRRETVLPEAPSSARPLRRSAGFRKPSSFSRTMRGLSPAWMDMRPSITSWRYCCSRLLLFWSFRA